MKSRLSAAVLLSGALFIHVDAVADCPGKNVQDAKRIYERALAHEKQGNGKEAVFAFAAAQGYVCENHNPYEQDAARRAAPLALSLGKAAEAKGDLRAAFDLYEAGGHFALADRVLMEITRANQDSPSAFMQARSHFGQRTLTAFQSNRAAALAVTGPYQADPKYLEEVKAMPARGVERAAQKEASAFNEQYLHEYVQLIQSRPDDLTDPAAIQRSISAQQAFAQKWSQEDPIKQSREAMELMRMWAFNAGDEQFEKQVVTRVAQLAEQRIQRLTQKYSGAPKLLEHAMGFLSVLDLEPAQRDARMEKLRAQARKLGDDSNAKHRYSLAVEYYEVAGESAKADAIRQQRADFAMQKMQPSIDEANRQAQELARNFSDPAAIEAMRAQAVAARQQIEREREAAKQTNRKKADELETELGL
jgi:hypothetical protein